MAHGDPLIARAQTPIHVLDRYPEHMDVFAVAVDHDRDMTISWDSSSGWGDWHDIPDGRSSSGGHGSPVTAIARYRNHMDLFTVDLENHPCTASWSKKFGFTGWTRIPGLICWPGSTVNVVSRYSDQMDIFTTASDHRTMSAHWTAKGGWQPWFQIERGVADYIAPYGAGATVTAVARHPAHLDVFTVGTDHTVFACWWDDRTGWHPWSRVGALGTLYCRPDSAVTVTSRHHDQLDLFTTASDGKVMTIPWSRRGGWGKWAQVAKGYASEGSEVTAISRYSNQLDLFVVAPDNLIYHSSWHDPGPWTPWINVSRGTGKPGGQVAAVSRYADHIDLFAVAADDRVWSCWWDIATNWSAWFRVPPPTP